MIRLFLLALAFCNMWAYFNGWFPAINLASALGNLTAAVAADLLNTAWHRA